MGECASAVPLPCSARARLTGTARPTSRRPILPALSVPFSNSPFSIRLNYCVVQLRATASPLRISVHQRASVVSLPSSANRLGQVVPPASVALISEPSHSRPAISRHLDRKRSRSGAAADPEFPPLRKLISGSPKLRLRKPPSLRPATIRSSPRPRIAPPAFPSFSSLPSVVRIPSAVCHPSSVLRRLLSVIRTVPKSFPPKSDLRQVGRGPGPISITLPGEQPRRVPVGSARLRKSDNLIIRLVRYGPPTNHRH